LLSRFEEDVFKQKAGERNRRKNNHSILSLTFPFLPDKINSCSCAETMKFSVLSLLLAVVGSTSAFAPQSTHVSSSTSSTQLHLFGGGNRNKDAGGGGAAAPGMMEQMAMFKKAQEMAQKKGKLDAELAKIEFSGLAADGKVTATFKFIPTQNPMDPNPDYNANGFVFDDEWYAAASPEDLSAAVKEAIENGIKNTNDAVALKYQALQGDLMAAMGGGGDAAAGAAPPAIPPS
jgi:hypothetical protein